jgi:cystathionine beta-lyase/cystathionine gamma-synthase
MRFDTALIHGGEAPREGGAVVGSIARSTTYLTREGEAYSDVRYARLANTPQHDRLHARLAAVCGGEAALGVSSGMGAIAVALCELVPPGGRIVASRTLYGGSLVLLGSEMAERGVEVEFVDVTDTKAIDAALSVKPTDALYLEPLSNPLLEVANMKGAVSSARRRGVRLVVDNTFLSPANARPLELGADVVVHSATKYMAGHTDVVAGVIAARDPELIGRMRSRAYRVGHNLDPQAAFLLERGLKTLSLRVERQNATAVRLVGELLEDGRVERVLHPSAPGHPGKFRLERWARGGGGVFSFELADGLDAEAFARGMRFVAYAPSLGGAESLVTIPWKTSHASVTPKRRLELGISPRLVRFSVGLEDPVDLLADIGRGLEAA